MELARKFEIEHQHTIINYDFKLGDLVLRRNTAIKKALNRKMRPRYEGLMVVILKTVGGSYVISKLNGAVYHQLIAVFRLIPYFARKEIPMPNLDELLDIGKDRLEEMRKSKELDPNHGEEDIGTNTDEEEDKKSDHSDD